MNCIRCIKYCHVKWKRKTRRLYIDDKGVMHDMKDINQFMHEQRMSAPKGDSRRNGIYG